MTASPAASSGFNPAVTTSAWGGRASRAEVDLDAIAWNVGQLAGRAAGSALMTVVKANAYGHGAVQVASAALGAGASWLGVYTVDEGVALRRSGIDARILVFGPFTQPEAASIARWRLTPTVTHFEAGRWLQDAAAGRPLPYHMKVDTGLSRAGVSEDGATALWRELSGLNSLTFEGIYTHLARADEQDRRPTNDQLDRFERVCRQLRTAGAPFTLRHVANSAGTLAFPDGHFNLVRAGISTYGYYPSSELDWNISLRPALQLLSAVSRVTRFPAGTGVGYGHEFRCTRESVIALVPLGYGDGLPRSLGNGRGAIIINGYPAPIVGRVSMDQITVDVTDGPPIRVGDEAALIGSQGDTTFTAEDVAQWTGTISYDILTGLMPRVPRVYVRGGQMVEVSVP